MFTRTGDDTDTVGNIEEFLQQCLEDGARQVRGPWQAAYRPQWLCGLDCWSVS